MKCDVCGNKNSYIKEHEHVFTIKGKKLKFTSPRRFCRKCDNLVYDADLDNNASLKAIEEYSKLYGVPKESIVEFRNHLNLSQELFSKIIGCAKKTLVSYEKGTSLPNDNELIIIKSLLAKPETIVTLVTANKEQFTDKEYNKIQNKLEDYLGNNIKNLFYEENFMPTELNGYTKLDKNKIFNMIFIFSFLIFSFLV